MAGLMDVTMPDGYTIIGIPEGTSKEAIMDRYTKYTNKESKPNLDLPDDPTEPYRNPTMAKIGPLNDDNTAALLEVIGKRESSNNYKAENRLGYVGKYQFGAAALVDTGFVDSEKYHAWRKAGREGGQKAFLSDETNWNYEGGKKTWMADKAAQDEAIRDLLGQNLKRLKSRKAIKKDTTPQEVAGYLMAAHLGGWSNAVKLAKEGADFTDANGTSIQEYFKLGKTAVADEPTPEKPTGIAKAPETDRTFEGNPLEKLEDGVYQDDAGELFAVNGGKVEPYVA